jgi:hypothetical protein
MGDTDEAIGARVGMFGYGFFHTEGMCAMREVVDGACRFWVESAGCEYYSVAAWGALSVRVGR